MNGINDLKKTIKVLNIYPLGNALGTSVLFFAFLIAVGLGEGDVENDRDL